METVVVVSDESDVVGVFCSLGIFRRRSTRQGPYVARSIIAPGCRTHVFPRGARPAWGNGHDIRWLGINSSDNMLYITPSSRDCLDSNLC